MADKPKKRKRGPYGRFKYDQEIDHEYVEKQWLKYDKKYATKEAAVFPNGKKFRLNIARQEYLCKLPLEKPAFFFLEKLFPVDEFS